MPRLSLLCLPLLFAACSPGGSSGPIGESPVALQIELRDDWPDRGDGFTLRVHQNGQATVQETQWDVLARLVPAPIVPIGRLDSADRRLLDELSRVEVDDGALVGAFPLYAPNYPILKLTMRRPLEGSDANIVERVYQTHVPELPSIVFAGLARLRELHGDPGDGDWEATSQLYAQSWERGQPVFGSTRIIYHGEGTVTLGFTSGCQFRRTLIDEAGREYGENQVCTLALTYLDFASGQGRSYALDFDSSNPPDGWPTDEQGFLPVGKYTLRGELLSTHFGEDYTPLPEPIGAETQFEIVESF